MRIGLLIFLFTLSYASASTIVNTKITASGCTDKEMVQVIVIKKDMANQFLYQVGVPHGGNADFNFIPGEYRIEAISDKGCFGKADISVKEKQENMKIVVELKP